MYAIIVNNNVLDKCDNISDFSNWIEWCKNKGIRYKIVDMSKASSIKVYYTEMGGSSGYGHQEVSFEMYGGIVTCLHCLGNWAKDIQSTFGPDYRDIRDFFKQCRCYVNGEDKSEWFWKVFEDTLKKDMIYA